MDPDFTALASRVAARAEVLGCIILSRDGLVLGAFPPNGEQDITPGLLRFAAIGDPDRGFVEFADELWAYVRQGSYAAFAVAEHGTRPGILLDYLEQALLVAEEGRQFGQAMAEPVHVDLSKKGIGLGRRLRASTSDTGSDFRAAVAAPAREAAGSGHEEGDEHGTARGTPLPAVPKLDDGALDEALAAAVAVGGSAAGRAPDPEPDDSHAAFETAPAARDLVHELVAPPDQPPAGPHEHAGEPAGDGSRGPGPYGQFSALGPQPSEPELDHAPEPYIEPTPEPYIEPTPEPYIEPPPGPYIEPPPGPYIEPPPGPFAEPPPEAYDHPAPELGDEHEPRHEDRPPPPPPNPDEIDRIALAREFAQLLQEGPAAAD